MLNSRNQIIQDFDDMVNVLTIMVAMVVSCTVQWDCDQWCRGGLVSIHRPLVARPPVPGPAPGPISGVATTSVVLATPSRADITHQVGQETIIYVPKSCKWVKFLFCPLPLYQHPSWVLLCVSNVRSSAKEKDCNDKWGQIVTTFKRFPWKIKNENKFESDWNEQGSIHILL